jgi:hypothetical protein
VGVFGRRVFGLCFGLVFGFELDFICSGCNVSGVGSVLMQFWVWGLIEDRVCAMLGLI